MNHIHSIESLAADLASRVPEMALDSPLNNAQLIENFIRRAIAATSEDELVSQQECEIALLKQQREMLIDDQRHRMAVYNAQVAEIAGLKKELEVVKKNYFWNSLDSEREVE